MFSVNREKNFFFKDYFKDMAVMALKNRNSHQNV